MHMSASAVITDVKCYKEDFLGECQQQEGRLLRLHVWLIRDLPSIHRKVLLQL